MNRHVTHKRPYEELRHRAVVPPTPGFGPEIRFDTLTPGGLTELRAKLGPVPTSSWNCDRHVEWNDLIEDSMPFTVATRNVELPSDIQHQQRQQPCLT